MAAIPWGSTVVDSYKITGPARIKKPTDWINEAADPHPILRMHLTGMSDEDKIRGGKSLTEFPITSTGETAQETLPGQDRTWSTPNVLESMEERFSMVEDALVFNQILRDLNAGTGSGGMSFEQIKSEKAREEIRCATSLSNKLEAQYFAEPSTTLHASTGVLAKSPIPMWMILNEYEGPTTIDGAIADSSDPAYPAARGLPAGFTSLHGINGSTSKWFRTWKIPYNDVGPTTSTIAPGAHNLLRAFYRAFDCVQFQPVFRNLGADASDTNRGAYNTDYFVPCSRQGMALVRTLVQTAQNHFRVDASDPYYPSPTIAGVPFFQATGMDRARIYPTSGTTAPAAGAGVTEENADNKGPRFPLVNKRAFRQFVHNKYWFHMWPAKSPDRQHDNVVIPVTCMHQRMFLQPRRCAFIYPVADITGFGGG